MFEFTLREVTNGFVLKNRSIVSGGEELIFSNLKDALDIIALRHKTLIEEREYQRDRNNTLRKNMQDSLKDSLDKLNEELEKKN